MLVKNRKLTEWIRTCPYAEFKDAEMRLKAKFPPLLGICMQTEQRHKVDLFNVNRVINRRRFSVCEERGSKCPDPCSLHLLFPLNTLVSAPNLVCTTQEMSPSVCPWRGMCKNQRTRPSVWPVTLGELKTILLSVTVRVSKVAPHFLHLSRPSTGAATVNLHEVPLRQIAVFGLLNHILSVNSISKASLLQPLETNPLRNIIMLPEGADGFYDPVITS